MYKPFYYWFSFHVLLIFTQPANQLSQEPIMRRDRSLNQESPASAKCTEHILIISIFSVNRGTETLTSSTSTACVVFRLPLVSGHEYTLSTTGLGSSLVPFSPIKGELQATKASIPSCGSRKARHDGVLFIQLGTEHKPMRPRGCEGQRLVNTLLDRREDPFARRDGYNFCPHKTKSTFRPQLHCLPWALVSPLLYGLRTLSSSSSYHPRPADKEDGALLHSSTGSAHGHLTIQTPSCCAGSCEPTTLVKQFISPKPVHFEPASLYMYQSSVPSTSPK